MKSILFISNISPGVSSFSYSSIVAAKKMNMKFHMAANYSQSSAQKLLKDEQENNVTIHQVDIERSPYSLKNYRAYEQLVKLVKDENIDYIHCNTPIGGVIGRLLNKHVKKVIYEAHGFHFYKGAPLKNWLMYYPVEKILAKKTNAVITINKEDYEFAKKHLSSKVYYVPGVGIELEQWSEYKDIRSELGLKDDDFVALVVGRLEKNKNCGTVIEAVKMVPGVKLVFCGDGEDRGILEEQAKDLGDRVIFLGNRSDMSDVYHMADCFILASYREGLSRSIMEAMACGLPCIVSDIRGNRDLINNDFLFDPTDASALAEKIEMISNSEDLRARMKTRNLEKIKEFRFEQIVDDLSKIYEEVFGLENVECE